MPSSLRHTLCLVLAMLAVSGCDRSLLPSTSETGIALSFDERLRPDIRDEAGLAARLPDAQSTSGGYWGMVRELDRAERALVRNTATGREISVALFAGPVPGRDTVILLSDTAADELGILDAPMPVRVIALRLEPKITGRAGSF